jgi:23S rRNA (adenine2503-C2)-methyltransferase
MPSPEIPNVLFGLDLKELTLLAEAKGQASFRARQLADAIYRQRVTAIDQISTLSQQFRTELSANFSLGLPQIDKSFISSDGTIRYLIGFPDGQSVETV